MGKSTLRNIGGIIQNNTKLRHRDYHEIVFEIAARKTLENIQKNACSGVLF